MPHPSTLEADTHIEVRTTELGRRYPVPWPRRNGPTQYVGFDLVRKGDEDKVQADHVVKGGRRYKHTGKAVVPTTGEIGAYFRKQIRKGYLAPVDEPKASHSAPAVSGPAEESTATTDKAASKTASKKG